MLDAQLQSTLAMAPHAAVAWYLMASFAYYHRDKALISDGMFDHVGKVLHDNWAFFQHPHKHLISPADLVAGSLYRLRFDDYPTICRDTADLLLKEDYK